MGKTLWRKLCSGSHHVIHLKHRLLKYSCNIFQKLSCKDPVVAATEIICDCEQSREALYAGEWPLDLVWYVFSRLDGLSLGRASCTCKTWFEAGVEAEDLWKSICLAKWPSLDSSAGADVVKVSGGGSYRKLFGKRMQKFDESQAWRGRGKKISLEERWFAIPQKFVFLIDVSYGDEVVYSVVRHGHELNPVCDNSLIYFVKLFDKDVRWRGTEAAPAPTETMKSLGSFIKDLKLSWTIVITGGESETETDERVRVLHLMDSESPNRFYEDPSTACSFYTTLERPFCWGAFIKLDYFPAWESWLPYNTWRVRRTPISSLTDVEFYLSIP